MEYKDMKALAKEAGLKFPGNISADKLRDRLKEADLLPVSERQSDDGKEPQGSDKPIAQSAKSMVVIVTGPKRGRWRIGRHFTHEPITIPVDELSDDEQTALIADPKLSVETREAD